MALFGKNLAAAYAYGTETSVAYPAMLEASVDYLGVPTFFSRILSFRLALPPLPFVLLVFSNGAISPSEMLGIDDRQQAIAVVLSLLAFKIPFLVRTCDNFVDGLSGIEIGKTGMVGTVATLAARQTKKMQRNDGDNSSTETSTARPVSVLAGPSGVGKSTLIHKLMDEFPRRFRYSVSHTTLEPHLNELQGRDYMLPAHQQFEDMKSSDQFVEYAHVHGQYYGKSYDSVNAVLEKGTSCDIDMDIQGVEALRNKAELWWQPLFVLVATPDMTVLEERLKNQGTETSEVLKTHLNTNMSELSYAVTTNIFELTITNDDIDEAYSQLR
ncbi:Guanylate kinase [Gracilaria domingensis]|nr:Guanylate kinase [Gracilaria domingensis]